MVAEEWVAEYFRRFAGLAKKDLAARKNSSLTDIEQMLSQLTVFAIELCSLHKLFTTWYLINGRILLGYFPMRTWDTFPQLYYGTLV